ncbi:MAG: RNA polymerase sigma factor [Anaerolineae bacterium]
MLAASPDCLPGRSALAATVAAAIRWVARWVYLATGNATAAEVAGVSTEDLILRFQRGQPRAFETLYDRFKDYVFRVAFSVLRNQDEAEDAVQETFLDVLKALQDYDVDGPARFETWLYRVAVNRSRMRLRHKRPASAAWDDVEERLERLPMPDEDPPERVVLDRERAEKLWDAVDQLPDTHRLPIILRYQEDLSYDEIAQVLGVRLGTVKSRLYNAHKKLQRLLGGGA